MTDRKVLYAEDGMVLTDGTTYGKIIFLADGVDENTFYPITDEEFEAITENEQQTEATEADYLAALGKLGVSE